MKHKMECEITPGIWITSNSGTEFVNKWIKNKEFELLGRYLANLASGFRFVIYE